MKPQDSFLTSEKFCAVLEFLKCLLACAAGGFVAYALKKGDIRSPVLVALWPRLLHRLLRSPTRPRV